MTDLEKNCGLYIISPPQFELKVFSSQLIEAFTAARDIPYFEDRFVFQLRLKDMAEQDMMLLGRDIRKICSDYEVPFIMNDSLALAEKLHADGLHIGPNEGGHEAEKVAEVRKKFGKKMLGVSCKGSYHIAMIAAEAGVDYVSFGAFYPTKNKSATARPEKELLTTWSQLTTVPCVAIGGITPENCGVLAEAGADFVAMISAIWEDPQGPGAAVKKFAKALQNGK